MENKMEIFKNEEFGSVRIIQDGDKYLFCGSDVAKALGYTNPNKAISDHCRYITKRSTPHPQSPNKMIAMVFITEGDVYRLITHSKLPSAERFEHWTFDEVLPTIRKHGTYMTDSVLDQVMQTPELVLLMAEKLLRECADNDGMRLELSVTRPKVEYYDAFVHPEDCTNIRATAKELQVAERWFCRFLQKAGFLYRCPSGTLMPYNNPKNAGLFRVKDYVQNGHKGAYTLITPKGKALLCQLIRDCGEQAD